MEQLTSFVASRGLLKSCGCHNQSPISSISHIDINLLKNHKQNGSIYVCTDALNNFAINFLPKINEPFVLVSGDSDIPITNINDFTISTILNNKYLLSWYAQNLSTIHPKLFHLPIGLDYHTMWEKPGIWGLSAISPIAQENMLISTLSSSPEFTKRYLTFYCNWHFQLSRGDRQDCYNRIDKTMCYFEPNFVPRSSAWVRQAECMFVLSPEGVGIDCHRTWEAILLGCIPIVKRNAISNLFVDLPVLIVDDWSEVTRDTMIAYINTYSEKKFNFSSLFSQHWTRKITMLPNNVSSLDNITHSDFRKILTRTTN